MGRDVGGRRRARVAFLAIGALALLLTSGRCAFDTRDPSPPEQEPVCPFTDALRPFLALRNFEQAFACGVDGSNTFERSLEPDFDFNAAAVEDQSVHDVVDAWQDAAEPRQAAVTAFGSRMTAAGALVATLSIEADVDDEVNAPNGDGYLFDDVAYLLEFKSGSTPTACFAGVADIYVRQSGTDFRIYRWDDAESPLGIATLGRFWSQGTDGGDACN